MGLFLPPGTQNPQPDLRTRTLLSRLSGDEAIKTTEQNSKSSERMGKNRHFYQRRHVFVSQELGRARGWKTQSNELRLNY